MTGNDRKTSGLPLAFTISGGTSGVSPRYRIEEGRCPAAPAQAEMKIAARDRPSPADRIVSAAPPTETAILAAGHLHAAFLKAAGAQFDGGLRLMVNLATCDPADAWTIHADYLQAQMALFYEQSEELTRAAGRFLDAAFTDR